MTAPLGKTGRPIRRVANALATGGLDGGLVTIRHGLKWRLGRMKQARSRRRIASVGLPASSALSSSLDVEAVPVIELSPERWAAPSEPPIVAVVVTAWNREELLPLALRSLQLQGFDQFECVIVDDASTDATAAVAQSFADVDGRFRVVVHDRQLGSSAARNTGLASTSASWVCFLDDDDFLLADSLERRYEIAAHAPNYVGGAFCGWTNIDPHVGLEIFHQTFKRRPIGDVSFSHLRSGVPFIMTSPLLRRTAIEAAGGFDETVAVAEDADFWFRLLRRGFTILEVDHVGVVYRRSPKSKVLGDPERQLRAMNEIFVAADRSHEDEMVGPLPIYEGVQDIAMTADRLTQVLRYLSMIALRDLDRAVELGCEILPPSVRAGIRSDREARHLVSHAISRLMIVDARERFSAEASVFEMLRRLVPDYDQLWESRLGTSRRIQGHPARTLAPTPDIVSSDGVDLSSTVLLLPEALYHVDELGPLSSSLKRMGIECRFMLTPKTLSTAHSALGAFCDHVLAYDESVGERCRAIVVLNDWGPVKSMLQKANDHGVPTFAKVEGVQDFDDHDTGRDRQAYRTASVILGQGRNDVASLPTKRVEVVGSTRLERIWNEGPVPLTDTVLVNLNFTFHVLTEHRSAWIASVVEAIRRTRRTGVISAHPAERTRGVGLPFASKSFRHEITRSGVLVSRFSTVPFEAMARGVPFIYHNPHAEKVPTFADPRGAFPITDSVDGLIEAIQAAGHQDSIDQRERWESFFRDQIDIDESKSSEDRTADLIADLI